MSERNFKVKAIRDYGKRFVKDQIYEFKDGVCKTYGDMSRSAYYLNAEELIERNGYQGVLIEYKEDEIKTMYEVGDSVLIKDTLNWIVGTSQAMYQYGDRVATIIEKAITSGTTIYRIDLDGGKFQWTDGMIRRKLEETKVKKLEVGDKVIIRSDLELGEWYGANSVNNDMALLKGKEVTIASVISESKKQYHIEEDTRGWYWTSGMFEEKKEEEVSMIREYKVGDKVRIKEDISTSSWDVVSNMLQYKGKIGTIERITTNEGEAVKHYLDIDSGDYWWTLEMIEDGKITNFLDIVASIKDGETYTSKGKTISMKDGILTLEGCDNISLDEEFVKIVILKLEDVLKEENDGKRYRVITLDGVDEGIYYVNDTGDGDIDLRDDDENDISEEMYLSKVLTARFIEVTE